MSCECDLRRETRCVSGECVMPSWNRHILTNELGALFSIDGVNDDLNDQ